MSFEYELPDVGEGVAEGQIVAWHVDPGEAVTEDQVLAEIETDKAVVDLPAPVNGTVEQLHADVGDVVPVGNVAVTLAVEGQVPEEEGPEETAPGDESPHADERPAPPEPTEGADGDDTTATPGGPGGERVFAPPNVRRLAREMSVEIASVAGSGPGGRITEQDVRRAAGTGGVDDETVEDAIASVDEEAPAPETTEQPTEVAEKTETDVAALEGSESVDRDQTLAVPATRHIAREEGVDIDSVPTTKTREGEAFVEPEDVRRFVEGSAAEEAAPAEGEADAETAAQTEPEITGGTGPSDEVTREPYAGIRRSIGNQMEESAYTAPHVTHHDTAVVDALVETRQELNPRAEERGVNLTYLPLVMKAVVAGLREFPVLNARLDEKNDEVVYRHYYNVGVAVATDAGLMVPVVENVDEKSVLDIAREVTTLTERARDRSITREEMQGGTFSITNFGVIGGEYATPLINYPETAILGLGAIEQRPVAEDGEVVARQTLPLSLSIDHRVIDGAEAAQFTNRVIEFLETPELLLLEG